MPALRTVCLGPGSGFPDRPWMDHPDEDAFARGANTVCELYSEGVHRAKISTRHSELRLNCRHDGERNDVLVMVHPELTEGFEIGLVTLPPGTAGLAPGERARLILEVVHAAAARLGRARGWDPAGLTAAYDHALAAGLRFRWDGPPRTSPDRRHLAQPRYVLDDDGYGRAIVQIRRRDDGTVVGASPEHPIRGKSRAFAENARTVRWRSKSVVEFLPDPSMSAGPSYGPVVVDLADPASFGPAPELAAVEYHGTAAGLPAVVTRTPAELGPRIETFGGGPMNRVPPAYADVLDALLGRLTEPEWQRWWAGAGCEVLEVSCFFAAARLEITARRAGDTLRATIRRPDSTFQALPDPAATARSDVEDLLATVRRRTGLGGHPPL